MYPIFIPASPPPRCPQCDKSEKKVEVCGHCEYRYLEEEAAWWMWLAVPVFFLAIFVAFALTCRWVLFPILEFIFFG